MKRALLVLVTAALLAATAIPEAAHAQRRGGAVAAGLIGGLAVGAILGATAAQSRPAPVYVEPERVYVAPPPPRCTIERGEPVWDDYRGVWRRPRVEVCD